MSVSIRRATEADVDEMSAVMTASITELCVADHHDDPAIVAGWTRNKSADGVRRMLRNPDVTMFVAERDGVVAAVGSTNAKGEIGLNYVSPAHRFGGVSKALLLVMEEALRDRGTTLATLTSTATAYQFYKRAGWQDAGPPQTGYSVVGYPMRKALNP